MRSFSNAIYDAYRFDRQEAIQADCSKLLATTFSRERVSVPDPEGLPSTGGLNHVVANYLYWAHSALNRRYHEGHCKYLADMQTNTYRSRER